MIIHFFSEIWFLLFSISFLNINKRFPKITKILFIFPILVLVFYILNIITGHFFFIALSDAIGISLFPLLWFIGFISIKKNPSALFFVIGYSLLIPFSVYFIIGYPFGFWEVRGDMKIIKIASWFDIVVFTYAISYKMKSNLEIANNNILELKNYINNSETNLTPNYNTIDPYLSLLTDHVLLNKPLTIREVEVLKHLLKGQANLKISAQLFISPNTLKSHIRNIYLKTNVNNRKSLIQKINL